MATAGLWPRQMPRPTESVAEHKVYEALSTTLPDGWWAWHSMKLKDGNSWEGEGDFVIAIPDRGFLVLEVKGGQLKQEDGLWYQNSRAMEKGPREQANKFARLVEKRLWEKSCAAPAFGVLTIFPDTHFDRAPGQDDLCTTVLGQQDLPWLGDVLKSNLDKVMPSDPRPAKGQWVQTLHALWGETWKPHVSLGTQHELNEERRIQLDRDQVALLEMVQDNPRMLVRGGAGSGKTILARERALQATAAGQRVCLLCFTDALANQLRDTFNNPLVAVDTVGRYAAGRLLATEKIKRIEDNPEFWKNVAMQAACEAMPPDEDRPDLVIVDEAQDLGEGEWLLVQELARDRACWVFCDSAQAFWTDRALPDWVMAAAHFNLKATYRCPPPIMALANAIKGDMPDLDLIKQGMADGIIKIWRAPAPTAVAAKVGEEIKRLLSEGLEPVDIAVLSLRGRAADGCILDHKMLAEKVVFQADNPAAATHIVVDSFLRFKGLERSAVIITDLHLVKSQMETRLHIALTRALDVVRIVGTKGDFQKIELLGQLQ